MSIPAFAWALEQGRLRELPTSERMLLVVIADRGNGDRACYAGQVCLAKDTGLKERQVRISLQRLEAEGLIRTERVGKSRLYHVLRPNGADQTTPAHTAAKRTKTPAHTAANSNGTPAQNAAVQRTTPAQDAPTPAHCAKNTGTYCRQTFLENQENLRGEASEGFQDPGKGKQAAAPPTAPPKAPQLGTTTDSSPTGYIVPGKVGPFADDPLDRPADPGKIAAAIEQMKRDLRMRAYPPRAAALTRDEQADSLLGPTRPKTAYLSPEHLAMLRRQAGIHVDA